MKQRGLSGARKKQRVSVSLDDADYRALHEIALSQKPPLSDSYVAAVAIRRFIEAMPPNASVLVLEKTNKE
jgi:hypothetical protein